MKITIVGTGIVGQTFAEKFIELGYSVIIGTRNVEETINRENFKEWHSKNGNVVVENFNQAISLGDIVLNALKGEVVISTFSSIEEKNLKDKIVIDITNPLDFSNGFPPFLIENLNNTNSLGEELQKVIPSAKVVKTLNTMWCGVMINPKLVNNGSHTNYICGNDIEAKKIVISILDQFGWDLENILDLGDITNARGTESILMIWTRIYGKMPSGAFNFKIVQ